MTDTVSLTIKIDPALKETLKTLALENQLSLSEEVSQRLHASLLNQPHPAIDSPHTAELALPQEEAQEEPTPQLTNSELKQLRTLLKKGKKKK
ncbi:hypothetical protein ACFSFZ_10370 [Mixta tenebrionis]|uniref:Arc family DNA-binding protein n=1 Tax=Mixta tenebrionis TaxID=2562439 RepID=A0A506V0H4_9GAMM|nr:MULTISPECIES: hypothetical protein [Mixta]QHM75072.1 hypothetical protein C7M52_01021 [Mixta theicola]TPW38723.1 hypothetical protein FKM52_20395 [Mixta tenebrionis]